MEPQEPKDAQNIPAHLELAAQWASVSLSRAQTEMLSTIETRIQATQQTTHNHEATIGSISSQYQTVQRLQRAEQARMVADVPTVCEQIDRLGQLMDAVERNLGELEEAMGKAEAAVGISLGGRLEQLARFLSSGGKPQGVPYLRQWAPKEQAVPKVIKTSDFLD
ncbi:hypothetical protein LPJ73_005659 [Coemansia sp. RSA 2703]|nr:hypothetical protein LPJ73_005659 [Coemansia sp. RSA 2703]